MKTKFCMLVWVLLFASSLLYPGTSPQNEKEKIREKMERKSLIRKELLMLPEKTLSPPRRNIFTRKRTNTVANEFTSSGDFQTPVLQRSPVQQESAIEEIRADVKYIGYVKSGTRVVALIIFENRVYAVESGDILEMGLTIGEITPDDMEIFDKGSEPRRINLEGEKP